MQSAALEPADAPVSANGARLMKNTSALVASQLLTWGLTLLLTLFMPRYLGPEAMGLLAIAVSLWTLLQVFIGFGMDTHLVKQIARDPEQVYTFLGTTFLVKLIFYLLCLLPVSVALWMVVVQLVGLSFFLGALASGTQATLQGLEIMEYISISNIASRAINSLLGIGVLLLGFGLYAISIVLVIASMVLLVAQLYFLQRYRPLRLGLDRAKILPLLRNSLPYVATALVMVGYAQLNVLIIGLMMSTTEAGWYGAAVQLFATLLFLPVAFGTALLPQMTRTHSSDTDALPAMLRKSVELVLLVGVPIGFGLVAIAEPLVALIFGPEYGPTGPVLQVLGVALIFMYLNVLIGQFFTATDRQNVWTVTIAISVAVMAGLTFYLVPLCQRLLGNGALGGAFSLLLSEASMVIIGAALLRGKLISRALLWSIARVLVAGGAMLAVVWFLRDAMLLIPIVVGMLVYPAMVLLLRIVPREDLIALRSFAASLLARLRPRG
jgi:O-antigen/teichoic acid export membrane protein